MAIHQRRHFLAAAGAGLAAMNLAAKPGTRAAETVYRFLTPECDGRMSVRFFDRYESRGFWFRDRAGDRDFCLSGTGNEGRGCLAQFSGAIAVAVYHLRSRATEPHAFRLRERVLTIDHDGGVAARPPFERTLEVKQDIVSDIQAFGYDAGMAAERVATPDASNPWCLFRQDLYFDARAAPFLIVHWKHTLNAITLIDVIPGDGTQVSKA